MGDMLPNIPASWSEALAEIVRHRFRVEVSTAEFQPLIMHTQQLRFGDYTTGIGFKLARSLRKSPAEILAEIRHEITAERFPFLEAASPAGGYLNLRLQRRYFEQLVDEIHSQGRRFGRTGQGRGKKILLEYVSANPTGPLTIAHARQAAIGDSLARILTHAGYEVTREFYKNDTGGQIEKLGRSIHARLAELEGKPVPFPEGGYHGEYIREIARVLRDRHGPALLDRRDAVELCAREGRNLLMEAIVKDLERFRTEFDVFTSQEELERRGVAAKVVETLRNKGLVFEKDGAVWLRTTRFGDDKDRVLVKKDGAYAYRTPDIGYHWLKFERGFDRLIDLLGPDHHQHAKDLALGLKALGYDADRRFQVLFVQHCRLMREGREVKMSKRQATYVTLRELLDEVGVDAARYFFAMRKPESHLDFDIEVARKQSLDNPVYYAQYAHARICNIYEKGIERGQLKESDFEHGVYAAPADLARLGQEEIDVVRRLERFPSVVADAAKDLDTTKLTTYLRELSGAFQAYYTEGNHNPSKRVLTDDPGLTAARLRAAAAVQIVLRTGLNLLGVSAPRRM